MKEGRLNFKDSFFQEMWVQFPLALVITDVERRVQWVNHAFTQMCGYELHDLVGLNPAALLQGPATNPVTSLEMKEAMDSGKACHVQILNYHKDGSEYWADIQIMPVHGYDGEIQYYFAVERDVSQDHQREECLEGYLFTLYDRLNQVMESDPLKECPHREPPSMTG